MRPLLENISGSPNKLREAAKYRRLRNIRRLCINITAVRCGKTKNCVTASCNLTANSSCLFASTVFSAPVLAFELRGASPGYIAVGLGNQNRSTNNTFMFACAQQNGTVSVFKTRLINNSLVQNNLVTINSSRGSVSGNITQCTFNIFNFTISELTRAADLTSYVYLATGNYTNGTLGVPRLQVFSSQLDLSVNSGTSPFYSILGN
ncbi:hypothetical protein GN956_G26135 [Arapaima gigas]